MLKNADKKLNFWKELPPALSNEETCALIREGSEESLKKVVLGNLRLIRAIVSQRYENLQAGDVSIASQEDLQEECVFVMMKCVKRFDPDKGIAFSTFVSRGILNVLAMEYRRQGSRPKSISLDDKVKGNGRRDEDGIAVCETIFDRDFENDKFEDTLDNFFINTKVLPLLSRMERAIFVDYFQKEIPSDDIGLKYNMVRTNASRYLNRALQKVKRMVENGITDEDLALRKVSLGEVGISEFRERRAVLKKFGEDFLRRRFLPKLTPVQASIFKSAYLNFYGQSKTLISIETGVSNTEISNQIKNINKILQDNEDCLLKEKKEYDKLPIMKTVSEQVAKTNQLVEHYGGRAFLWKYFVPILNDSDKRVFIARILNFDGTLSNKEIAESLHMDFKTLKETTLRLVDKMKTTDFEMLNELIDNSIAHTFGFDIDMQKVKERKQFLQKFGDKIEIIKKFAPTLNKTEKQIFEEFYLFPSYIKEEQFEKANNLSHEQFKTTEKEIRSRLEKFDFKLETGKSNLRSL